MKSVILNLLFIALFSFTAAAQIYNDATLAAVRRQDANVRSGGRLPTLSAQEHAYRAEVYFTNRAFPEAREHAAKIIENYPNDSAATHALFVIGRSYMWEKQYALAVTFFDDLIKTNQNTKDVREGTAFKGACLVRIGKPLEAAKVYEQYIAKYPTGERFESSYLNAIDAYREANKDADALSMIARTRQNFPRSATETNAVFAQLRMQIARGKWREAVTTAEDLRSLAFVKGAMTNANEAMFLKAYALERADRRDEAVNAYFAVPDNLNSYYGEQATIRLQKILKENDVRRPNLQTRISNIRAAAVNQSGQFPAVFRDELLRSATSRRIDPRFVLAIMKQESSFKPNAKSPSAARGLLQMTIDTAGKYQTAAGYTALQPEDLYKPGVNITLGSLYIADLQKQFPNILEAVAASYNGGEDNAARWLKRADSKEPFVFTAEVGFSETKDYVFKVLSNYRAYRELYTEDLRRR